MKISVLYTEDKFLGCQILSFPSEGFMVPWSREEKSLYLIHAKHERNTFFL